MIIIAIISGIKNNEIGHDDVIESVAVSVDNDLVVSGSRDGTCILHSLQTGKYLRSLSLSDSIDLVRISFLGMCIISSLEKVYT